MVDSVAGAVVSAAAVLLVAWMVASPLASSPFPQVASQVRQSALVQAVDHAVPDERPHRLRLACATRSTGAACPTSSTRSRPPRSATCPAPDEALLNSPVVASVQGSVVKISGIAPSCSRQIDGSGFVYAQERVMTNAHVLAGVTDPVVLAEGEEYDATPVYVDERIDVAVLAVPGLPQVPLTFTPQPAESGDDAIIMGYPGGGPFYVGPARVRDRGEISGPDFRDTQTVVRDVYALFGTVRAGNSGGPLFATDGSVLGVVFASAIDDPDTGYALTAQQVADAARTGQHRGRPRSAPAPASEPARCEAAVPSAGQSAIARLTGSGASSCGKWPIRAARATRRPRRRTGRSRARCSAARRGPARRAAAGWAR